MSRFVDRGFSIKIGTATLALLFVLKTAPEAGGFSCPPGTYQNLIEDSSAIFTGTVIDSEEIAIGPNPFGEYVYCQKLILQPDLVYKGDLPQEVAVLNVVDVQGMYGIWSLAEKGSEWLILARPRDYVDDYFDLQPETFPELELAIFPCFGATVISEINWSAPIFHQLPVPTDNRLEGPVVSSQLSEHYADVSGFGIVFTGWYPWIIDRYLGPVWDYSGDESQNGGGDWFYSPILGNFWREANGAAWIYSSWRDGWLYIYSLPNGVSWLYSGNEGRWEHLPVESDWESLTPSWIDYADLLELHDS